MSRQVVVGRIAVVAGGNGEDTGDGKAGGCGLMASGGKSRAQGYPPASRVVLLNGWWG